MNCSNCGAPMALVPGKDFFHCEYCSSYHFPRENDEGVRILGEPGDMDCPVCRAALVLASVENLRVLYCPRCRGILAAQPIFYELVQSLRRRGAQRPARAVPLNRKELERRSDCPRCHRRMSTHPYLGPGSIVIDICERCSLVWLDHGEITRIMEAPRHN